MHRRLAAAVLATALLASGCAMRSDRSTAPVELPVTLPTSVAAADGNACALTVGPGRGAEVTDTIPGSPGAATFASGDVIVRFGDEPITSSADLVRAVGGRGVGDTVEVALDTGESRSLTLRENPEAAGNAQLGVLVTTAEDRTPIAEIATGDLDGDLVRVVQLDGRLWLFDPVATEWRSLEADSPPVLWVALRGEVYSLSLDLDEGGARIGSVRAGTDRRVDFGEWDLEGLFTTLEDVLLVGTSRTAGDGTRAHGVAAVDPTAGTIRWAWGMPADDDPRTSPSFGFRSPTGSMNLIALTADNDLTRIRYLLLREVDGTPEAVLGVFPEDFVAIGWNDATHVAGIVPPSIGELVLVDVTDGSTTTASIGLSSVPIGLWPVGDGAHLMVEDGSGLQMIEIDGPGRRRLSLNCTEGLLGETGW